MADDRQTSDLDRRIASAKRDIGRPATAAETSAESRGWAVGVEFVGAVLGGAFIGYLLDRWLHTAPWLMIVFLFLGFGAGLRRAMQTANQFDSAPNDGR